MRLTLTTPAAWAAADTTRGTAADPVAEIVTFRLNEGTNPVGFAVAADNMTPFLRETHAALARTLSVDETGLWTDYIVWRSMQAAKSAAAEIMQQPSAAPFMQMINPDTVSLRHAPIRFSATLE